MKFLSIAAIFVFGILTANAQPKMGGVKWRLAEVDGKAVKGSRAYIEFDESRKRFTGNAGCNQMFGSYESSGENFKASGVGTTRMACMKPGVMETERAFLKAIADATMVTRNNRELSFYAGDKLLAKFRSGSKGGQSTGDLTSKKWMLKSIGGKAVSLSKDAPFLSFDAAKKSAGGNSGCNVFGGSYETTGASIKFGQMISTMRACEFEDRMTIERGFLDGLQNADRYEIKGGRLLLYKGGASLLEFEGTSK